MTKKDGIQKLDIKQKNMAAAFNVSETYLSSVMNGNRKAGPKLEKKIESYISKKEILSAAFLSLDK